MELTCKNPVCEYLWEYLGEQPFYATCPRCHYKVKIEPANYIGEEDEDLSEV